MILDESLKHVDEETIRGKMGEIIEYMRRYYDWVLMISHDKEIMNKYKIRIGIEEKRKGNRIIYKGEQKAEQKAEQKED